ncbi:oligosaccharide flippase family protein [Galactobacillus timonensis]|uniref:oligosaccharide flippase family protein n=1 Tax=Galactobacillus timonensis TaxID=2041840 RepID=UPI000C85834E|nr:oligosaccharide flippase family protein [Galactobacillus timonensis]
MENINSKIGDAAKWSTMAELFSKLASPIVNMVLARVLSPEAFGIVASITIVTSFADIFTDAGFQRYIIQHEYESDANLDRGTNVAFWANFVVSSFIYLLIVIFRKPLSTAVGASDAYNAFAIAGISIICTSFSSTQTARFRRDLKFRPLFIVRVTSAFIPLIVTVPLAFVFHSYWAMVIGTVIQQVYSAVALSIQSNWRPRLYFSFKLFRQMFSFSMWNLLETLAIWFAGQAGIFIVGRILNSYYLGLYKTAMTTVNSYMGVITASITPVLFSGLSRYQNDAAKYNGLFFKFQRIIALFMLPMGLGLFIFRELAVEILLGTQWLSIANFLGTWALMSAITITFSNPASEVYRSKGLPQISLILQIIYLMVYIPSIWYSAHQSFNSLCSVSCLIRIFPVILDILVLNFKFHIIIKRSLQNIFPCIIASAIMGVTATLLNYISDDIVWQILSVIVCIIVYFAVVMCFRSTRTEILSLKIVQKIRKQR